MSPGLFESPKQYWRILPFAAIVLAVPALAQMDMSSDLMQRLEEPMPYMPAALGPFTHAISSKNAEAQAFFDQGFQMRYAFGRREAIRSFREAWKRDPDCAICYWGEAYAWGSDLNWLMSKDDAPHAYHAMQEALRLRDKGHARRAGLHRCARRALRARLRSREHQGSKRGLRRGHARVGSAFPERPRRANALR